MFWCGVFFFEKYTFEIFLYFSSRDEDQNKQMGNIEIEWTRKIKTIENRGISVVVSDVL